MLNHINVIRQLGYSVPFTSVHAGKYGTEGKSKKKFTITRVFTMRLYYSGIKSFNASDTHCIHQCQCINVQCTPWM